MSSRWFSVGWSGFICSSTSWGFSILTASVGCLALQNWWTRDTPADCWCRFQVSLFCRNAKPIGVIELIVWHEKLQDKLLITWWFFIFILQDVNLWVCQRFSYISCVPKLVVMRFYWELSQNTSWVGSNNKTNETRSWDIWAVQSVLQKGFRNVQRFSPSPANEASVGNRADELGYSYHGWRHKLCDRCQKQTKGHEWMTNMMMMTMMMMMMMMMMMTEW